MLVFPFENILVMIGTNIIGTMVVRKIRNIGDKITRKLTNQRLDDIDELQNRSWHIKDNGEWSPTSSFVLIINRHDDAT